MLLALLVALPVALAQVPVGGTTTPSSTTPKADAAVTEAPPAVARVVKVYDGDTFTLETNDRVRVLLINTPELRPPEPFAEDARDFATEFVLGKKVALKYGTTLRDGYGRLLAEPFVDNKSLSLALVEKGLAHVALIPPIEGDSTEILAAQDRVRAAKVGIWTGEHFQGTLHISSFHADVRGADDREKVNGEYLRVCNISGTDLNVKGYSIMNSRGKVWVFPELVVPPGHTLKVHAGVGETQRDPTDQLAIFLGSETPIWNNSSDRATIFDPEGKVVDYKDHKGAEH